MAKMKTYYTKNFGLLAPYEEMTEEDLYDFEVYNRLTKLSWDQWCEEKQIDPEDRWALYQGESL